MAEEEVSFLRDQGEKSENSTKNQITEMQPHLSKQELT